MAFHPLKLLLYIAVAALEITLFHLGLSLLALAFGIAPRLNWLSLFGTCLIAAWTMLRFETAHDDQKGGLSKPTLAVLGVTMAYAVKVQAGGGWSPLGGWDLLWPFAGERGPDTLSLFGLLLVSLWSWWRGMSLVDNDHTDVLRLFQRGVLALVLLTILVTPLSSINLGAPPWGPQFALEALTIVGLGLFSLALARIVDEMESGQVGGIRYWLRSSLFASIGVLCFGTLLLTLISDTATLAVRAIFVVVVGIFALLLGPLVWLITRAWLWLIAQVNRVAPEVAPAPSPEPGASPVPHTPSDLEATIVQILQALLNIVFYLLPLLVLLLLILTMQRRRKLHRTSAGVLHESLWSWQRLRADLADLLHGLRLSSRAQGLRDALARLRRDDPVQRIRRRYIELLLLGEATERPRQPQQTPLEYSPVVTPLVPNATADVQTLTNVYDQARYAPDTIKPADAAAADAAWAAIQSQSSKESR